MLYASLSSSQNQETKTIQNSETYPKNNSRHFKYVMLLAPMAIAQLRTA